MKKSVSLLLVLALFMSLCACGVNESNETTTCAAEATSAPTEEKTVAPTVEVPTGVSTQPAEETEAAEILYTPYIGNWVCSDGYYVIVNEDGTLIYNDVEYTPEYFEMGDGVAVYLEDAEYTYYAGMDKNGEVYVTAKGCVFVWGLTERFGEGVMVGDHDGRHFVLQSE